MVTKANAMRNAFPLLRLLLLVLGATLAIAQEVPTVAPAQAPSAPAEVIEGTLYDSAVYEPTPIIDEQTGPMDNGESAVEDGTDESSAMHVAPILMSNAMYDESSEVAGPVTLTEGGTADTPAVKEAPYPVPKAIEDTKQDELSSDPPMVEDAEKDMVTATAPDDSEPTPLPLPIAIEDTKQDDLQLDPPMAEDAEKVMVTATAPLDSQPTPLPFYMNAGGTEYTDSFGRVWAADLLPLTPLTTFANIQYMRYKLYQTERYGSTIQYDISVPNGDYEIDLRFAEIYWGAQRKGARVFDVFLEGDLAWENMDIFREVGGYKGLIKKCTSSVSDGLLTILLVGKVGDAKISAIEVRSVATAPTSGSVAPPTDTPVTPPTEAPVTLPVPTQAPVTPPTNAPPMEDPVTLPVSTQAPVTSPTNAPVTPAAQEISVTSFVLVNADTNKDIYTLKNRDVINLDSLPTKNLNIRAETSGGENIGSVKIALDGTIKRSMVENSAPYSFAGDLEGDYLPLKLGVGMYTATATPYSEMSAGGTSGTELAMTFFVISKPIPPRPGLRPSAPPALQSPPAITRFVLVNADTDKDIQVLEENAVLALHLLPTKNLNIRAETSGENIGGVVLVLKGPDKWTSRVENDAPYSWAGDTTGDYLAGRLGIGKYTLSATPFAETDGRDTAWFEVAINFSVTA